MVALACLMLGVAGPAVAHASNLLGSDHGGHYWFTYCQDKPDETPLPADPRSLVTPTLDKAVAFNVAWYACLGNSPAVENAAAASFFAYYGQDGCAEKYNLIGYLAQPLHGVRASAPYFHNGSVPTVWGVLKSSSRPLFWRRISRPAQPGVVMGYETDLARA